MARIPEAEIERLKNEVEVVRLVEAAGIELKRGGKDWLGRRRPKQIRHCCETKSVTPPLMTTAGRQKPSNGAGFRGLRSKAVTSHPASLQRSKFVTTFLTL